MHRCANLFGNLFLGWMFLWWYLSIYGKNMMEDWCETRLNDHRSGGLQPYRPAVPSDGGSATPNQITSIKVPIGNSQQMSWYRRDRCNRSSSDEVESDGDIVSPGRDWHMTWCIQVRPLIVEVKTYSCLIILIDVFTSCWSRRWRLR
jgi:hypothetical protein